MEPRRAERWPVPWPLPRLVVGAHGGTDLWVIADFHATAMAGLQPGSGVSLTVDALQDHRLNGQVDGLSPATASEFSLLAGNACRCAS